MSWDLLTNHALVLIHVTEHHRSTLREIAASVGITERAALSILRALEEDNIIARRKDGRRNVYSVDVEALMAHRSHGRYSIEELASALFVLSGRPPMGAVPGQPLAITSVPSIAPVTSEQG
jgi:DNA-binding MarR family transcriptional regulator